MFEMEKTDEWGYEGSRKTVNERSWDQQARVEELQCRVPSLCLGCDPREMLLDPRRPRKHIGNSGQKDLFCTATGAFATKQVLTGRQVHVGDHESNNIQIVVAAMMERFGGHFDPMGIRRIDWNVIKGQPVKGRLTLSQNHDDAFQALAISQ
ncbi:hypothetical protein GALMADRAFT_208145 [Galerina marginata CBS 339.88]|uniref:Uncharacterized protein n=1 Tax=Galerina marginata (strain CBS 339.88) TaxID=685588 RepID=A0A067TLN0_GALM3|nr:hypothetical protein GALMADRAFT_208145 [Galerina marginata CBS 339.88]